MLKILLYFLIGVLPLCYAAFYIGRKKARTGELESGERFHSRPAHYGWYSVIWMAVPSLVISFAFTIIGSTKIFKVPFTMHLTTILLIAAFGLWYSQKKIAKNLKARNFIEKTIKVTLIAASLVSILTTIGIVFSILFESMKFFSQVSFWNFITGTEWDPDTAFLQGAGRDAAHAAEAKFGSVPIFAGTLMITLIALAVAVPIGLFSAIFMSEYASSRVRGWVKPVLEILAGIPSVVYGFFAAITVSPLIVHAANFFGLQADYTNALTPGLVMGIMIIPFVSSLSDDVINAIPQNMREGSLALGMTRSETMKHVLLPAAMPGIISSVLLAFSRAIGETMIVVMAAGLQPKLSANPLDGMTTVTVKIVDALTGDQSFDSLETLSAFGLSFVLLIITLILNIVSSVIIRKFRKQYV
ncbi:phosphate ABC transporter permease subunit PstC [Seleniivibrio woodruffii]|uniref:Phosphate transport system permease protein n=1 Tax=Seleniivibrio woodruffii TaxID=1078050 RepID=A0A4R1K965_9BACT|nr:phosphate ABC transporter permease subunit PstC [Seleniivibrio woodruffii]TCK60912.1 phosphate ABC transporter membrane protein 1 (PhoT family) [Seleniivibrio woodruffii]TVZ36542.1 phosphate ABC transporter membrane protein 1 (PhoT family) [Seleniivibrio woodruffii]